MSIDDVFSTTEPRVLHTSFGPVHYRDFGHGEPIVFVHGFLANGHLWAATANRLAATHRCIVPDWPLGSHAEPLLPGADLSPGGVARLVAELIATLELEAVTLVGNDTGGVVCQLVVAEHPERIGRLVLTPCDGFEVYPPPGFGYLRWLPRIPGLLYLLALSLWHFPRLRRLSTAYGALSRRPIAAEILEAFVSPGARQRGIRRDTAKYLRGVSNKVTLAVATRLPTFKRPALLVWNDDPRFFPPSLAHRLAAVLPAARVQIIADTGVFLPLDRPDVLADRIREFTEEATASPAPVVRGCRDDERVTARGSAGSTIIEPASPASPPADRCLAPR